MMMRQTTAVIDQQRALEIAVRSLSIRAYSQQEMHDKLKRSNCPEEILTQVLQYLNERGYLNDAALVDVLFRKADQSKKYGRRAILLKLRQRGIPEAVIELAAPALDPVRELENALGATMKKFKLITTNDRARVYRFLAGKGFSGSVIGKVCDHILP